METKTKNQYKTWGKSRSNRLSSYDYSQDRPIHVTICTDSKRSIFESKSRADKIIEGLLNTAEDTEFRILCFCLMPEHLHLILSPGPARNPLSKFLNIFKGRTTALFREKNGLKKVWQNSAFDHIIRREEDLRGTIEYILNNPVRKGLVKNADEYPYSGFFDQEIQKYV